MNLELFQFKKLDNTYLLSILDKWNWSGLISSHSLTDVFMVVTLCISDGFGTLVVYLHQKVFLRQCNIHNRLIIRTGIAYLLCTVIHCFP